VGFLVVSPTAASADFVSCGTLVGRTWVRYSGILSDPNSIVVWRSYDYLSIVSTPTFNASDTRIAVNDLDNPATVTFTSQKSQTFSISVTASMVDSLTKVLSLTVSASIQASRTTSIGVSVTATVPAHAGVRGDYGVQAFNVAFDTHTWEKIQWPGRPFPTTSCVDLGVQSYQVNAPTSLEGWRVGPL
jgi:hypothetical protein